MINEQAEGGKTENKTIKSKNEKRISKTTRKRRIRNWLIGKWPMRIRTTGNTPIGICSVPGRSIFDGCVALLSAVEACHKGRRPVFILNLDLFHAFDRVCLPYLDCVLEAMGFGITFRAVVTMLHDGAAATFLLQTLSREMPVEFSVR